MKKRYWHRAREEEELTEPKTSARRGLENWRVYICRRVFEEMLYLAKKSAPSEIQMLAEVSLEGKQFNIERLHLLKQTVSGASASFDPQAVAELVSTAQHPEKLRGWIHSHVDMGNFWSGTDEDTIKRLCTAGWLLSIVMCTNGSMRARLDISLEGLQKKFSRSQIETDESLGLLMMVPTVVTRDNLDIQVEGYLTAEDKERLDRLYYESVSMPYSEDDEQTGSLWREQDDRFSPADPFQRTLPGTKHTHGCGDCAFDCESRICLRGVDRMTLVKGVCTRWIPAR